MHFISTKSEDKSNNILQRFSTYIYLHNTCTIHAQYMRNTCAIHAQYMHNTCTILMNLRCIYFVAKLTLCLMNYQQETCKFSVIPTSFAVTKVRHIYNAMGERVNMKYVNV